MAIVRKSSHEYHYPGLGLDVNVNTVDEVIKLAKENGITDIPFDVEELIKRHGIRIVYEDMNDDMSGYIEKRNACWVIGVNQYQSPGRQRFTLAHEFAHYLLHREIIEAKKKHEDYILLRGNSSDNIEVEANRFAGELLVPKNELMELLSEGVRKISELASKFNVSIATIRYRAFSLGLLKRP